MILLAFFKSSKTWIFYNFEIKAPRIPECLGEEHGNEDFRAYLPHYFSFCSESVSSWVRFAPFAFLWSYPVHTYVSPSFYFKFFFSFSLLQNWPKLLLKLTWSSPLLRVLFLFCWIRFLSLCSWPICVRPIKGGRILATLYSHPFTHVLSVLSWRPHRGHFTYWSPYHDLSAGMSHTKNREGLKICSYPLISPELCAPAVLNYCGWGRGKDGRRGFGEGSCDDVERMKPAWIDALSKLYEVNVWFLLVQKILIFVVKSEADREQAVSFVSYLLSVFCLVTPSPANMQRLCDMKR